MLEFANKSADIINLCLVFVGVLQGRNKRNPAGRCPFGFQPSPRTTTIIISLFVHGDHVGLRQVGHQQERSVSRVVADIGLLITGNRIVAGPGGVPESLYAELRVAGWQNIAPTIERSVRLLEPDAGIFRWLVRFRDPRHRDALSPRSWRELRTGRPLYRP